MSYTKLQVETLCKTLRTICRTILLNAGLYQKEGIYQDLLIRELNIIGHTTIRERVFNCTFKDSIGSDIRIGNNQCFRSDIELPDIKGILELKASNSDASMENIWQLRNYLNQRPELRWGILINFISKCSPRCRPKIECIMLYRISDSDTNNYCKKTLYSEEYLPEQFNFEEW